MPDRHDPAARRPRHLARAVALSREHMQAGAGGPFGAVIVRDGRVLARGLEPGHLRRTTRPPMPRWSRSAAPARRSAASRSPARRSMRAASPARCASPRPIGRGCRGSSTPTPARRRRRSASTSRSSTTRSRRLPRRAPPSDAPRAARGGRAVFRDWMSEGGSDRLLSAQIRRRLPVRAAAAGLDGSCGPLAGRRSMPPRCS